MVDLSSVNSIYSILGLVVPGLVALFIRAQFLTGTGRNATHSEAILSYFTLSAVYYALVLPIADLSAVYPKGIVWFVLVFVGPAIFGVILGLNAQKGFVRRIAEFLGIRLVHVIPAAWDWKFSSSNEQWVLVTLKDGTEIAGLYGVNSFTSSDPGERDIYIEKIYDLDDNYEWIDRGQRGILISAGEISTIDFWPVEREGLEDATEQQG